MIAAGSSQPAFKAERVGNCPQTRLSPRSIVPLGIEQVAGQFVRHLQQCQIPARDAKSACQPQTRGGRRVAVVE